MNDNKKNRKMPYSSQNCIPSQCAATSVGTASQLFLALIQTLIASECSTSPSNEWPPNFGDTFKKHGNFYREKIGEIFWNFEKIWNKIEI